MKRLTLSIVCLYVILLVAAGAAAVSGGQLVGARFPAISPDGSKIAFSYMGDLWIVSSSDGQALNTWEFSSRNC